MEKRKRKRWTPWIPVQNNVAPVVSRHFPTRTVEFKTHDGKTYPVSMKGEYRPQYFEYRSPTDPSAIARPAEFRSCVGFYRYDKDALLEE